MVNKYFFSEETTIEKMVNFSSDKRYFSVRQIDKYITLPLRGGNICYDDGDYGLSGAFFIWISSGELFECGDLPIEKK